MFKTRICKECGEEFQPSSGRQFFCKKDHYRPCPVCGVPVLVKYFGEPPRACSEQCKRRRMEATNIERHGTIDAANTPAALAKRRATNLQRYGTEDAGNRPEAKEKRKQTSLERYGVENPGASEQAAAKRIETNRQRYGVDYAMSNPDVAQRSIDGLFAKHGVTNARHIDGVEEKIQATCWERYGVAYAVSAPGVREKSKQTNLLRYNTIYPTRHPEVQAKIRSTNLDRYGYATIMNSPEIKQRAREGLFAAYGVEFPGQSDELRARAEDACMKLFGHRHPVAGKKSAINRRFAEMLDTLGVDSEFELALGRLEYDIYLTGTNVVIELNPTYTHSTLENHFGPGIASDYHLKKLHNAADFGYRCIHLFDWDDLTKAAMLFAPKSSIGARKCELREIPVKVACEFESLYHLQGKCNGQLACYGLYYNNQLIQVMTFGKPRYNKNYEWELLRLCTHPNYQVGGGASRLFKHFIRSRCPQSVISYCDISKFSGHVYTQLGMKLDHATQPTCHWSKGAQHVTDNLLRQRGYDQLFGTDYGKGTSNTELMISNGWRPVYDCGQSVYVWT